MPEGPLFGIFLPQLRMPFSIIEARVRTAEEAGFDSAWFMDHLAPPAAREHDTLEAWTLASAIAARTISIRLGHLVLCNPFRHPALLAKMAAPPRAARAPAAAARDAGEALARTRFGTWGGLMTGTPAEVAAALRREVEAGVELFVVQLSDFGTPETIELFANEVIPEVRGT